MGDALFFMQSQPAASTCPVAFCSSRYESYSQKSWLTSHLFLTQLAGQPESGPLIGFGVWHINVQFVCFRFLLVVHFTALQPQAWNLRRIVNRDIGSAWMPASFSSALPPDGPVCGSRPVWWHSREPNSQRYSRTGPPVVFFEYFF